MTRVAVLDWSEGEVGVLVGSSRAGRIVVEQAFRLDLSSDAGSAPFAPRLAAALAERRLGRVEAIVALGRSSIELRPMSLPAAPDDELPDLVRFQAMREFNALDEQWPLDYLPLESTDAESRQVLAAVVRPELAAEIRQACETAGWKLSRLTLRACGAASLLARRTSAARPSTLLVDLAADEAELTIVANGQPTFFRHVRLAGDPTDSDDARAALAGELRRTIVAARNQPGSRPVEAVALLGEPSRHGALGRALGEALTLATEVVDPLAELPTGASLKHGWPQQPERFAALVGLLWDELSDKPPTLDFLHPRQRPAPPGHRNAYSLAGLAAGLVVLALIALSWFGGDGVAGQVRKLQHEANLLRKNLPPKVKAEADAREIQAWLDSRANWLDELAWLSSRFPQSQDAMLTQLKLSAQQGRAELTLDGRARDVDAVTRMDNGLRDDEHRLAGKSRRETDSGGRYGVQFRSSVLVSPEEKP